MRFEPCDIVLTSGVGWLSDTIRKVTQSKGEPPSLVSHAGLIVKGGTAGSAILQEAAGRVRRGTLRDLYGGKPDLVSVWRPNFLSLRDKDKILASANESNGRGYGWGKIVLFLLDAKLLKGSYGFRRLGMSRLPFCTYDLAVHFMSAGYSLGVRRPCELDPDSLWDYLWDNGDKFELVRDLSKIP
jgi:hypothetical protein